MAVVARYLVDTSAAARLTNASVAERVVPLLSAGLVATCASLDYEALYSARSREEYERVRADRRAAYDYLPTNDEHWTRALDVQQALAAASRNREIGMPDLLVAVLAEQHEMTLLHYDADFDTLAELLTLRAEWVAPRGTIA